MTPWEQRRRHLHCQERTLFDLETDTRNVTYVSLSYQSQLDRNKLVFNRWVDNVAAPRTADGID